MENSYLHSSHLFSLPEQDGSDAVITFECDDQLDQLKPPEKVWSAQLKNSFNVNHFQFDLHFKMRSISITDLCSSPTSLCLSTRSILGHKERSAYACISDLGFINARVGNIKRRIKTMFICFLILIIKKTLCKLLLTDYEWTIFSQVRPFSCDICQKMFTRVEILKRHIKTHMVDKVRYPNNCQRQS